MKQKNKADCSAKQIGLTEKLTNDEHYTTFEITVANDTLAPCFVCLHYKPACDSEFIAVTFRDENGSNHRILKTVCGDCRMGNPYKGYCDTLKTVDLRKLTVETFTLPRQKTNTEIMAEYGYEAGMSFPDFLKQILE